MKTAKTLMMAITGLFTKAIDHLNTGSHMVLASSLPTAIKSFVTKEYPGKSIAFATASAGFVVELNDGTMLYFDNEGKFIKADTMQAPPSSLSA